MQNFITREHLEELLKLIKVKIKLLQSNYSPDYKNKEQDKMKALEQSLVSKTYKMSQLQE